MAWAPWIARGYALYGELLLTNTSGGHSFVFDLGKISVTLPDGEVVNHTNDELLGEAPKRFSNDYQSHRHAEAIFAAWYRQDPDRYWRIVRDRFFTTLKDHNVYLTTLSRLELFGDWRDTILIDKTPWFVGVGFAMLIVIALLCGGAFPILPWVAVAPWLLAIMVANTSRYLDPMVPLLSFGWIAGLIVMIRLVLIPAVRSIPKLTQ
jgi:hypothetical protein